MLVMGGLSSSQCQFLRLAQEMKMYGRKCKELQRQTEEDADKEVEELKEK